MKKAICFLLTFYAFLASMNSCAPKNNSAKKSYSTNSQDSLPAVSLEREAMTSYNAFIKEHERHKDNKDSAWISDLNGNVTWNSRSKSLEGKPVTVIDSSTHNAYILDSTHTKITAYNSTRKIIWKTDPHKDNALENYRHKNPVIRYFNIGPNKYGKNERVLYISYSNSQFGHLDLKTGKFTFSGQD